MPLNVAKPLSDDDWEMWKARLKEAQQAYHDLSVGTAVAAFTDQNGERVQFSKVDMGRLAAYIADITALLGTPPTPRTSSAPRPLRYVF